ncbi:hypothetical protein HWHPT5561_02095 [Petrotoga sp. HWH.PT.55.6.1]|uniref:hypothetical protein n=1 Tax=unclassified Petrotoga TaxID=2620614 RepID=UPI000CA05624|nr:MULTISPECIES: hypothetical protein [unclassified Petrotoga]PNR94300.1 hypothetical protein X926_00685 [Petrotoga sp. HWHPT.55.6.3]RPD36375.1 hypothetical protein HWHPT5561_02095 [Petrotoga sp. HWH.PT.55.6.1]
MKSKRLILVSLMLVFILSAIGMAANASNNDRDSQDTEGSIMQSQPMPLVIALHGGGGSGSEMVETTQGGFNMLADEGE